MITDEEAIKFVAEMEPISKKVIDAYYAWRRKHYGRTPPMTHQQKMNVLGKAIVLFEKTFDKKVSTKAVTAGISYFAVGDAQCITNVDNLNILGILDGSELSHIETTSYSVGLY